MENLDFLMVDVRFAEKVLHMKNKDYEKVLRRMSVASPVIESNLQFSLLCIAEGVDRVWIDNMLYADFGMSGEEILDCMRNLK